MRHAMMASIALQSAAVATPRLSMAYISCTNLRLIQCVNGLHFTAEHWLSSISTRVFVTSLGCRESNGHQLTSLLREPHS